MKADFESDHEAAVVPFTGRPRHRQSTTDEEMEALLDEELIRNPPPPLSLSQQVALRDIFRGARRPTEDPRAA